LPFLSKALDELNDIGANSYAFEVVLVDDHSTDGTREKLKELFGSRDSYRLVFHEANRGVAAAILTGLRTARNEIVCSMDADCSYDPLELLNMIPQLQAGIDLVTASPYHPDGFVLGVPKWRLFLSKSLSRLYHRILHHKLWTYTSCFRVYRRSSVSGISLRYGDFRGVVEVLARVDLVGGAIREYPATLQSRIFGYSKMKTIKAIMGHIKLLAAIYAEKYRVQVRAHVPLQK
jgi:glycosyltransferase involved in cell wall biosynthesis